MQMNVKYCQNNTTWYKQKRHEKQNGLCLYSITTFLCNNIFNISVPLTTFGVFVCLFV
jgi:hypothetical protein